MASPFNVFRRHQKAMLAVVGIMAMISFVFLPIIADSVRSLSRGGSNPVAVSSRFGDLRDSDLYRLRQQHLIVVNFLSRALAEVGPEQSNPQWYAYQKQMASIYMAGQSQQEIEMLIQRAWANQVRNLVERETGQATEQALAENWMLAKRARQLGIVISDEAVIHELRGRVAGLQEDRVRQIIESTGVGQQQLVEAFRGHLLAQRLRQMFQLSLFGSTPAQRWADYQKLHRQATVEVAVLPVAAFVAKTPDPDEKTLREYFDRFKDRPFDPVSPEPGFREPYRATINYFKAECDKFLDPKSVTDEEIAKYYEEHKSDYIKRELPKVEESAKPEAKPESPAKKPAEPPKAATVAPKPETTPAKTTPTKPEPPKEKPTAKSPEKAPEKSKEKSDTKGKSSSLWKGARVSLAAFEKEKEKGAPTAKPAESKPAQAKPAESKPAESKPAESKPAQAKPAETKPAAKPAEAKPAAKAAEAKPAAKAAEAKPAESKPAQTKPAEAKPAAKAEPVQYTPLAQVRDQIRDRLAREHAAKKIRSVLEPIRDQLRRYSAQLARAKGKNEEPPKFDTAELAKTNGLVVKHLELVSQRDVAGVDIAGSRTNDQQTFEQHVFRTPGLGRPTVSVDLEGNMYLFWKEGESKEHVPALDDAGIRTRVVSAWKTAQAFDLAKAQANRLAEKVRQSKTPLKESLKQESGVKVLEPKPFSWLTRGQVPMEMNDQTPPHFSRVEGLDAAGHAFMQTVFDMEPNATAVTMNMPKTEVYLVRADQFSPSTNVLWELFIHEDYGRYASAAYYNQRALYQSWLDEIKDAAAFQWKRAPDQREEGSGSGAPQEPIEAPQF
jgi:hypothetical protein